MLEEQAQSLRDLAIRQSQSSFAGIERQMAIPPVWAESWSAVSDPIQPRACGTQLHGPFELVEPLPEQQARLFANAFTCDASTIWNTDAVEAGAPLPPELANDGYSDSFAYELPATHATSKEWAAQPPYNSSG